MSAWAKWFGQFFPVLDIMALQFSVWNNWPGCWLVIHTGTIAFVVCCIESHADAGI